MKIKALITLVVGRGTEIAPNEITDVSDSEAKKLIERNFAEEVAKQPTARNRNVQPTKPVIIPPELDDDEQGEGDDNPDEQSGQQPV